MRPRLLLVVLVLSCTPRQESITTLRVLTWASEAEITAEQRIADGFTTTHPRVRAVVESIAANFGEKLVTEIAAGTPPDVFLLDTPDIPSLVDRGLVLDLAPFAPRVGYQPDSVFPNVLAVFERDDQLFAFPKGFTPMVVYYNPDIFAEASVPPPADDWTWDDFRSAARNVTQDTDGDGRTDIYAFNLPRRFFEWIPWVWSAGGDVLDPSGTRSTGYLDSEPTVATLEFLTSLVGDGVVPASQFLRTGDPMRRGRFYSGRQAMLVSGHWAMPTLLQYRERGDLRMAIAPIPRRPGAAAQTVIYTSGWAVPVNAPRKRLAVELAAYLASHDAQVERTRSRIEMPAYRGLAERLAADDTTGIEAAFLRLSAGARMPWGAVVRDFHEIEEMSDDIIDRHLLGGESVAAAAAAVARAIDRVISR